MASTCWATAYATHSIRKVVNLIVVALSLSAALVYGAADFFGGLASRKTTTILVVLWSQLAGLLVLALAMPFVPGTLRADDVAWGALCGVFGAGAVALLYRALAIGTMSVVSPITAVLAAMIPVLFGIVRGDRLPTIAFVGIVVSLIAVVAMSVSSPRGDTRAARGIREAIGAGVSFGAFFIILAQTRSGAGLYPLLGARTGSIVLFLAAAIFMRSPMFPSRAAIGTIAAGGICDMLANVFYVLAAHTGMLSIVAVLTSLYPASTVGLAAIVLRERLIAIQWVGVVLAIAGVLCISWG